MLRLVDLANRSDFSVGSLRVSPARRSLAGPGGSAAVEPIVMKVLLMLFDAAGNVVTRDDLFASAWGGVFVGDDSLNRAVARARKTLGVVAPGEFEIETIPRTGYRLKGENLVPTERAEDGSGGRRSSGFSRRTVVGSVAAAALAGAAGFGLWSARSNGRRFNDLLQKGKEALEYGDGTSTAADYLRQAVAIRSDDATAQGLLAFALLANAANVNKAVGTGGVQEAQNAVNSALRLDPNEPNARLAQIELQRTTLDLAGTENRLRAVLAGDPNNIFCMRQLWNLLQSAGRSRDALAVIRRAIAVKPLAAGSNFPLAQVLWITGRAAEADRVIDRALIFWPDHQYVRFARFTIFTFTGRPKAALAMLENASTRPQFYSPAAVALWRSTLIALDEPSRANIDEARSANIEAAKRDTKLASQAVISLSSLGQVDEAFDVANGLLVFRAPSASRPGQIAPERRASSTAWRFIPWLFTPPAAALRADPRFAALADGIGLTAYWAKRGIKPDYQLD